MEQEDADGSGGRQTSSGSGRSGRKRARKRKRALREASGSGIWQHKLSCRRSARRDGGDTASSRGQKYEEIRATCVELIDGAVPGCAISLTGKVSLLLPRAFSHARSHSNSNSHSNSTCIFFVF